MFDFTGMIKATANAVASVFNFKSTAIENASYVEVIKDKKDKDKALEEAEKALLLIKSIMDKGSNFTFTNERKLKRYINNFFKYN